MRLSTRLRMTIVTVMACFLLCLAFVGTASAQSFHPHISVTPHHVFTDANGCAVVKISGTGFIHSNAQLMNTAEFTGTDSNGIPLSFTPARANVDANGRFSQVDQVCSPIAGIPNDVFTICAVDNFAGLGSNCVNVRVN